MDSEWKRLTDFLIGLGVDEVGHTNKTYLAHMIGVYRYMAARGCDQTLCRAGMFHSIYGTELFQGFKLPLECRADVRALIGESAERLAYLNCAMDRSSFDRAVRTGAEPFHCTDRITGADVRVSRADFDGLCQVHLYDWLEQVPRSQKWDYRREAYRALAVRLGGAALETYDQVFAAEGARMEA
jgi:Domain of unknown function (DUF6817)